jgi:signal transduction histidine kinase
MRLKTKLALAITLLVCLIAGLISLVYASQLLHSAVQQSYDTNRMVAKQVLFALENALETGLKDRQVNPNNPAELRALEAEAVRSNAALQEAIDSANRYSLTVYDINIGDSQQKTLLSTYPENEDKPLPARPDYQQLLASNPLELMQEVFGPPKVFDVVAPLERNGKPFASVHVGVRTTFLSAVYKPWLAATLKLMGFVLGMALIAAFLLSNVALQPLEEISLQLDYWTANSEAAGTEGTQANEDTATRVSNKIDFIGQRMRNVEEVFSALKENLDQILGNLQDGILLFTGDGRAVLVSEAARRFLEIDRKEILGRPVREIFDGSTVLGKKLRDAFDARKPLNKVEVRTETGRRIQASMDLIQDERSGGDSGQELGALVTLHDLESVEEIGSELELSRRMASIGRLTSGVGHEVKNPINAIVVHLELLKTKLGETSAPAVRHLEVIDAEIHRLDRVVQTLVDFSRPVELHLREQDLRPVVQDVLSLAADELSTHNISLVSRMPSKPLAAKIDADLLKQAVLNVIQNGAQAMKQGGRLEVVLEEDGKSAVLRISDEGPGISEEIRGKIFDLYFTTKSGGSGIGLAMTYRILQFHHGSVEVQSKRESGAEFLLRIPLAATEWGRRIAPVEKNAI